MRFRPRRILTYLLVSISVVVVLANLISFNSTTLQLPDSNGPHVPRDGLFNPRDPHPVLFQDRFRKYEERSSTKFPIFSTSTVSADRGGGGGGEGGGISQTRLLTGLGIINPLSTRLFPPSDGRQIAFNGSENERYREQFVRRVRWSDEADDPVLSIWVPKADRKLEILDDRIAKQMSFVPMKYARVMKGKKHPAVRLKTIYVPSGVDADTPLGRLKFKKDKCPVSACNITVDSVHEMTADLRLLQADVYFTATEFKPPGQIWAIWILESPANTVDFTGPDNLINWTATYRWDSTLVTPYAKFVPFSSSSLSSSSLDNIADDRGGHRKVRAPPPPMGRNYAANKTKMVAWFVSNCNAKNGRWEFAQELQKYIPVDIFGACGTIDCPRSEQNECNNRLNAEYKFYLSFENSNCDHYVTEKFFENGLGNDVVPIVMGGRKSDYLKAAPPHSYIHVDDFLSVEKLADYLLKLNASDHLYNEYFRWKGSGEFINTKFWCRLCALLHDDQKPLMWYTKFHDWWLHDGSCTTERWNE